MISQQVGPRPLDYQPVRYAGSKLTFRGPQRDLGHDLVACIGGTKTHGRFIARPWPALPEDDLGMCCVNFGLPNAGPAAFCADDGLMRLVQNGRAVMLQILAAMNVSNSHYCIDPPRNDRFLRAEQPLRDLYPKVDFTEFNFTRQMMQRLGAISPERFARLRSAVQDAWITRMTGLIDAIGPPVILLWMAHHPLNRGNGTATVPERFRPRSARHLRGDRSAGRQRFCGHLGRGADWWHVGDAVPADGKRDRFQPIRPAGPSRGGGDGAPCPRRLPVMKSAHAAKQA